MEDLKKRYQKLLENFDLEGRREEIQEITVESQSPTFWQDQKTASEKMTRLSRIQKEITDVENVSKLISEGKAEEGELLLSEIELLLFLSGPYDSSSAIVSIHAGQGGVEAMDWASMLFRMYQRFIEKKGWKLEVIDQTAGEEAGIKSITFTIEGDYSYGLLKKESGVHRLVRQSPFNADKLRQTSFALVEVIPQIEKDPKIEIREEDLEWEFYRASSHGGQNVQKVSSAVRLRHKPTGIVVTAQSERYQAQNREYALKLLLGKLWTKEEQERKREKEAIKGGYKTPGWGNQIRSYVLHPYKMVKDLRTNYETSQVEKVLDGELDSFIEEELRLGV